MTIPQIHDRLFRNVFGDRREAAALLRPHLPAPLADALNWSTLSLLNRSYIDDDARASELDTPLTSRLQAAASFMVRAMSATQRRNRVCRRDSGT